MGADITSEAMPSDVSERLSEKWRRNVSNAQSIEEISRLEVSFEKLKNAEAEYLEGLLPTEEVEEFFC